MKKLIILSLFLFLIPAVCAQQGSIKLLALAEKADGSKSGAVVDLYLEIEDGEERVFLETFPLTKITTQISMRFAQQIACKELEVDCSENDFFFTIKAGPGIVGGPSAGSAASVLAGSLLKDWDLREDTAITGTINSGGVIGSVGGIKEKVVSASENGISRVLIPKGTRFQQENATNTTNGTEVDMVEFGEKIGIEVIEVTTFADAIYEFTGHEIEKPTGDIVVEAKYLDIMKQISVDLCNRTNLTSIRVENTRQLIGANITEQEISVKNFSIKSSEAFSAGEYYSSASYCFRSNVLLKQALFKTHNLTKEQIAKGVLILRVAVKNYTKILDKKQISSLTDLQTLMAVKERLYEVEDALQDVAKQLNETSKASDTLAYAEERFFSAITWARFFNTGDKEFAIDDESLKQSCMAKLAEADERIDYVRSFLPVLLGNALKLKISARRDLENNNYAMCLYKASKAKAEADAVLGLVGVEKKRLDTVIDIKLSVAKDAVVKAQQKGIFPIIAYSYYEYSNSLKENELDKFSSLLFAEYALELANLDLYFPDKRPSKPAKALSKYKQNLPWITLGIGIGLIFAIILIALTRPRKIKKKR